MVVMVQYTISESKTLQVLFSGTLTVHQFTDLNLKDVLAVIVFLVVYYRHLLCLYDTYGKLDTIFTSYQHQHYK